MTQTYVANTDRVLWRVVDGEAVLVHKETSYYYSLNTTGTVIWELLSAEAQSAADLVNAALQNEPQNKDLLSKLCEIYFVWGNRDSFVDAAGRLKSAVGDAEDAEWDKIVIMGQQIAGDHE